MKIKLPKYGNAREIAAAGWAPFVALIICFGVWQRKNFGSALAVWDAESRPVRLDGCEPTHAGVEDRSGFDPADIRDIKERVKDITMLSDERLENVVELTKRVVEKGIPGDLLEAGVWKGGASILIKATLAHHCSKRRLFCCDSYEGLPTFEDVDKALEEEKDRPMDKPGSYAFAGGVEAVKGNFARYGVLDDRVHFIKGFFNDTLPTLTEPRQLALLRMDGDMYSSTMDILENMYDRVVVGGYVIIDDYGHWPQCRRAVHDFFEIRGTSFVLDTIHTIDYTGVWFEKTVL